MDTWTNRMALPKLDLDYRSLSDGFLVAIGVILAILASFITCLGLNLQKVSLCTPGNEDIPSYRQPKWVAGFVCVVVGSIIDFLAFGLAPQSLLAPLAALSLVWNLGMASYLLNEEYNGTDIKAVLMIFVGTGITVVFANHEEKEYTLDELKRLYTEPRMMVYAVAIPAVLMLHYGLIYASQKGLVPTAYNRLAECTGYAGFAGVVGGQSVLFAKSTVELIKDSTHGDDVFLHLETYVIIIMMAGCLFTQISFLNGGLKRFDSLFVVPIYQSYWIISGVVGGLVYFGEWEDFSRLQMFVFIFGTLVTLGGLLVLTTKDHHGLDEVALGAGSVSYTGVKSHSDDENDEPDLEALVDSPATPGEVTSQHRKLTRAEMTKVM